MHTATGGFGAAGSESDQRPGTSPLLNPQEGRFVELPKRKLKADTLKRFGYFTSSHKGKPVEVAPYHNQQGEVVVQKLRYPDKSFPQLKSPDAPSLVDCKLFGQQLFGDRFDKRVVIFEGEIDAMTGAQVSDFKFPCVSINLGAESAVKCLKANYRWLDRFEEIVLLFDNDKPGQDAIEPCAQLFKIGKVKVGTIEGFKDTSEALQASKPGNITEAIYGAVAWRPKGIVNAADCWEDFRRDIEKPVPLEWPWPRLQEMTGGMLPGQCNYFVSGTGMGKTVVAVYENAVNLALKQNTKVAIMSFEATRKEVQQGLMSVQGNVRMHIVDVGEEQERAIHKATFGSRMIEIFDPETAEWSVDAILGYVRYCAKALDCKVIFVDPLSFIAAGMDLTGDERRALDKASRDFAAYAKELGVTINVNHHLARADGEKAHEEGAVISLKHIRGSGGIANFGSIVIGFEGNQQGPAPELRRLRILKNRPTGMTGIADRLTYDMQTGRYTVTDRDYEEEEKGSDGRPSKGGFGGSIASEY